MSIRPAQLRDRSTESIGRWLVLLATLAGLFAMHGMADHGTAHHGMVDSVMAHGVGHDDNPTGANGDAPTVMAAVVISPSVTSGPTSKIDGSMVGLCMAILVGFIIALLALRRLLRWWSSASHDPVRALQAFWPRVRDPDPPDLATLCILRC